MSARVSRLSLEGFRGATTPLELSIDSAKPVVVIFGENGTGKSTIVDAVDFVTNGQLGSLAGRQSTPAKDYLPALGSPAGTLFVELAIGDETWRAKLSGSKPVLLDAPAPRPVSHVLRRVQILELLAAKPADRYKKLSRFVAVPAVESAEDALRTAVKDTEKDLEEATRAIELAGRGLTEYWEGEGKPSPEPMTWARSLAASDASELAALAREAATVLNRLNDASVERERVNKAAAALAEASQAVALAKDRLSAAERGASAAEATLMQLLEVAEHYVKDHPAIEACPVCEQPIRPESVLDSLKRRRQAGAVVDAARAEVETALSTEFAKKEALAVAESGLREAGQELFADVLASRLEPVTSLGIEVGHFPALIGASKSTSSEPGARAAVDLMARVERAAGAVFSLMEQANADAARLNAVKGYVRELDTQTASAREAETLLERLRAALSIVESRRKSFVDGVLAAVSGRVCDLYAKIHPGEEIGDIKLASDPNPKKRASLNLSARFNEVCDVPPEGYFSESHLDTLGICVFIATAERSRVEGRPNLLVLDDILTSVDGPHLDRLVSLVHDEADEFDQVILTTHYRYWFEAYRRGHGPAGNACLIQLSPWSIGTGIRADRSSVQVDKLAGALGEAPLDRQRVASLAGVILESVLAHLSLCYRLRLPASRQRQHTLGELLVAVPKKLRSALEVTFDDGEETPEPVGLAATIEALDGLAPFRNWVGAHSNALGQDVPDGQVLELGQRTVDLARAVNCRDCGELAGKRAGTHWRCRCGRTRLTPLALTGDDPPSEDVIP